MSVSDTLQIMLSFGIFVISMIALVVDLISKFNQKNNPS
ncbi:putative holin-like toxin [Lactobacillus sp. S2-2]|nr:putative holin-like toxin [Lactobacillus sp. S2-2]